MSKFSLERSPSPRSETERAEIFRDPGFGRFFTDHMATARWTRADGWHDLRVGPLQPFSLHPSAAVFHYGQEIFEGLKAYRHDDGSVWTFRADANARRFAHSAERLALPVLDVDIFLESLDALIKADEAWVPPGAGGQSLYLRPFMIATEAFLGVRPADEALYCVVACPVGDFFPNGPQGVDLWVTTNYTRAAVGGTGDAKCGGNYGGVLAAQKEAAEQGCSQVLYVDGREHAWIEESGTMNIFAVTSDGALKTPPLGTILPGITRTSVLELADDLGLRAEETRMRLDDLVDDCRTGRVTEVFAAGTAAVITPINRLKGAEFDVVIGAGEPGATTLAVRRTLVDIQAGRLPDTRGWMRQVVAPRGVTV